MPKNNQLRETYLSSSKNNPCGVSIGLLLAINSDIWAYMN